MPKTVHYCANHPDVAATDVCSQCGKRICYNCASEAFGRIFCSFQCVATFLAKEMVRGVFRIVKGILRGFFWPFRRMWGLSREGWIEVVLGLGLLVCFYFLWGLTREVKLLEGEMEEKESVEIVIDTTKIPVPKIFHPARGGMVFSNTVDIQGEVEENYIVSLSIDEKLVRVALSEEGTFAFRRVPLRRGDNRLEIRAITDDGRVSTLQTMLITYANPTLTYLAKGFSRGSLDRKEVALTFDGGSIDNAADEILDILKEENVKSTFFLTGEFIRRYPKTVKRIVAEGHEVGNHTWSHPHLTSFSQDRRHRTLSGVTKEKIARELSRAASLFVLVTKQEMVHLWRAPYGEYNEEILRWAAEAGYKHVGWTVGRGWEDTMDTMDWVTDKNSKAYHSADEVVEKILNYATQNRRGANGVIILMHLGTHRKDDLPHRKLPEIIEGLRKEGYRLCRVSEMMTGGER